MVLDEDNGDGKMISEYIWKTISYIPFQVGESVADKIELVLHCVAVFVIQYLNLTPFVEFVLVVEW